MTDVFYGHNLRVFNIDTNKHRMAVLLDRGLHRHLWFRQPDSGIAWFEIVTVPGRLTISGDMGDSYTFSRLDDMFQFFRSADHLRSPINPHYWSEKLSSGRQSAKSYSQELVLETIEERIADYRRDYYPELLAEAREKWDAWRALPERDRIINWRDKPNIPHSPYGLRKHVRQADDAGELSHVEGAYELLRDLEKMCPEAFSDTWEMELRDYDWGFVWACHAIVWGIRQYDALTRVDRASIVTNRLLRRPAPWFRHDIVWPGGS